MSRTLGPHSPLRTPDEYDGQSDEFFGVSQIIWESSPWKQLSLVNDEEVISLSHAKVYVILQILCYVLER